MIRADFCRALAVTSALVLLGAAGSAQAAGFGSAAFQSARYCRTAPNGGGSILAANINCMGPANPDLQRKDTRITGGAGLSVDNSVTTTIGGELVSKVRFSNLSGLDLPIIKSGAWASADTRVASTIVAYMGFSYGGAQVTPYALDVLSDWTGTGAPLGYAQFTGTPPVDPPGEFGGEGFGSINLWLFDANYVPDFTDPLQIVNFTTEMSCSTPGVLANNGIALISPYSGYAAAGMTFNTPCGGDPGSLTLTPGSDYVLFAQMQTVANRGGAMDATHTIRVVLSETLPGEVRDTLLQNTTTARAMVPEPASWAMLIAGFGLTGAVMRRRRLAAA